MDKIADSSHTWRMARFLRVVCRTLSFGAMMFLPVLGAAERLVIKGSNTFGEELGPALIRAYQQKHSEALIELEAKGSASGLTALVEGSCDLAAMSHPLTEDEQRLAKSRGVKVKSPIIGYYGVAVIVHEKNPVTRLTDAQIRDIFTGRITRWAAIGGAANEIAVLIRAPDAGTYLGFQELAMSRQPYAAGAKTFPSDRELAAAVAANPHAIGFVAFGALERAGIRGIVVNRINPSAWNVVQNDYPYARAVRLCSDSRRESPIAREFVSFCLSREGQALVNRIGFVGALRAPNLPAYEP